MLDKTYYVQPFLKNIFSILNHPSIYKYVL